MSVLSVYESLELHVILAVILQSLIFNVGDSVTPGGTHVDGLTANTLVVRLATLVIY